MTYGLVETVQQQPPSDASHRRLDRPLCTSVLLVGGDVFEFVDSRLDYPSVAVVQLLGAQDGTQSRDYVVLHKQSPFFSALMAGSQQPLSDEKAATGQVPRAVEPHGLPLPPSRQSDR
jgi:hypothetical protein